MFRVCGQSVRRGIDLVPRPLVERMERRRGRSYAFECLDGARIALVVVDMTNLHVEGNQKAQIAAERINHAAKAVRTAGGTVLWVRPAPLAHQALAAEHLGDGPAARYLEAANDLDGRNALYESLVIESDDLHTFKTAYSAFFPGACDAAEQLWNRRIDTVLIAGIVADVCCDASARDAHSCGFRVIVLADAVVGSDEAACMASFAAIYRNFGDIRLVDEAIELFG